MLIIETVSIKKGIHKEWTINANRFLLRLLGRSLSGINPLSCIYHLRWEEIVITNIMIFSHFKEKTVISFVLRDAKNPWGKSKKSKNRQKTPAGAGVNKQFGAMLIGHREHISKRQDRAEIQDSGDHCQNSTFLRIKSI